MFLSFNWKTYKYGEIWKKNVAERKEYSRRTKYCHSIIISVLWKYSKSFWSVRGSFLSRKGIAEWYMKDSKSSFHRKNRFISQHFDSSIALKAHNDPNAQLCHKSRIKERRKCSFQKCFVAIKSKLTPARIEPTTFHLPQQKCDIN